MTHILTKWAALPLLLLLAIPALSQKKGQELIDSLQKAIPLRKDDTNKVIALTQLSHAWYRINLENAFAPAEQALKLASDLHWTKGIANLNNDLGLFISDTGNGPLAREYFERSYAANTELGRSSQQVNNLNNIGRSYYMESNFPRAMDRFFKALTIAEKIGSDEHMALVGTNIAATFLKQQDYKKAIEYAAYTIDHGGRAQNQRHKLKGWMEMGEAKRNLKDTLGATVAFDSTLAIAEQTGNELEIADALANRSQMEPDPRKRIAMGLRVDTILREAAPNTASMVENKSNVGEDYFQLAQKSPSPEREQLLKQAGSTLRGAIAMADARKNTAMTALILPMLVELEEYEGHYKTALGYYRRATTINDSLFSQDKKNEIAGLEGKHNIALKDQEIALNQLKLSGQRKTEIGLAGGVLLLAALGLALWLQGRSRARANAALAQLNQVNARFFGIISHDFRGPVASLLYFLNIQREDPELLSAADQARHRQELTESTENVLSTMESMLLWSKDQMEDFRPHIASVAVEALFAYLQKFFGQPPGIRLTFDDSSGLIVGTDEHYLRTIMQNLTANAIKAVRGVPGALIVWTASRNATGATVLSIADNGPGLNGVQAAALTGEGVGYNGPGGFGLHLVRDLAKAIHCKVEIQSEPGKGAVFLLTIGS